MTKFFERNEDALREAAAKDSAVKGQSTKSDKVDFYRFKKGKTTIRVMPAWNESGVWYKEYLQHGFKLPSGRWLFSVCATPFGKPCVLCQKGIELYDIGTEDSRKESKVYRPKSQFLMNAIILSDAEGDQRARGIVPLQTGIKVKRQILKYDAEPLGDEGYGDVTSLSHGFNLSVDYAGDTEYTVMPSRNRTNIVELLAKDGIEFEKFAPHDLDSLIFPEETESVLARLESRTPGFPVPVKVSVPVRAVAAPETVVTNVTPPPGLPPRPDFND